MPLYATPSHFPPSPSPAYGPQARAAALEGYSPSYSPSQVPWRHYVHEILKSDIKNEAVNLLKTKGRKFDFSHGEAVNILKIR
jgi:hypothetical protein